MSQPNGLSFSPPFEQPPSLPPGGFGPPPGPGPGNPDASRGPDLDGPPIGMPPVIPGMSMNRPATHTPKGHGPTDLSGPPIGVPPPHNPTGLSGPAVGMPHTPTATRPGNSPPFKVPGPYRSGSVSATSSPRFSNRTGPAPFSPMAGRGSPAPGRGDPAKFRSGSMFVGQVRFRRRILIRSFLATDVSAYGSRVTASPARGFPLGRGCSKSC